MHARGGRCGDVVAPAVGRSLLSQAGLNTLLACMESGLHWLLILGCDQPGHQAAEHSAGQQPAAVAQGVLWVLSCGVCPCTRCPGCAYAVLVGLHLLAAALGSGQDMSLCVRAPCTLPERHPCHPRFPGNSAGGGLWVQQGRRRAQRAQQPGGHPRLPGARGGQAGPRAEVRWAGGPSA